MIIDDVLLTPLQKIDNPKGSIYHALKASASGYVGFGEVYFSEIKKNAIKGWKRHNKLVLNIVVPVGNIRFVLYDDRIKSLSRGVFYEVSIGSSNYSRLTIPAGIWVAFKGLSEFNLLMNVISEEHNYNESDNKDFADITYTWKS